MAYRRTPAVQARIDAQRAAVLEAASQILVDGGYAACTIGAVAARAGIATGTVYTHVANKGELVAEVFRLLVTREVGAVAEVSRTGTPTERVAAIFETFAARALKHPRRAYALLAEPVDPRIDALRMEYRRAFRDLVAAAIADGVESGELPPQNATVVAAALVGGAAEALIGPLVEGVEGVDGDHGDHGAENADTIPTLLELTRRAIGGST